MDIIDEALKAAGSRRPLTKEQRGQLRSYDFLLWWIDFGITKKEAMAAAAALKEKSL